MKRILLSRTDSIGDVILTLPVAGVLKEMFPGCRIIFLGRDYTRDIVALSAHVDEFISWDAVSKMDGAEDKTAFLKNTGADTILHIFPDKDIARLSKKAGIQTRIGTTGRFYHYLYCNKLVKFSRKRSTLHEAQLNLKLLRPLGWSKELKPEEIIPYYGLDNIPVLNEEFAALPDPGKINLTLHPKSKGSAREWGLANFDQLVKALDKSKYKLFVTGTKEEGRSVREYLSFDDVHCIDLTGKMSLEQLIAFIARTDSLVAASTGPLHIAAALGKVAIGIYPPIKPMHPGRWAPLGIKANYLVLPNKCNDCRHGGTCQCMLDIKPLNIIQKLEEYFGK